MTSKSKGDVFAKYTPIRYHPYDGRLLTGYVLEAFDAVQRKPHCQTPVGDTYPAYRLLVTGKSCHDIEMMEAVVPRTERTRLREPEDRQHLEISPDRIEREIKQALDDERWGAMPITIDRSNLRVILGMFDESRRIRAQIEGEAERQCQQLAAVIVDLIKAVQSSPEKQGAGFWRILRGMLDPKAVEEIENNGVVFEDTGA